MPIPSTTRASISESGRSIATLVAAFIADPFIRWIFPDARQYVEYFPRLLKHYAGRAFEHGSAYRTEDFKAVALWLPPGVGPDEEAVGALLQESVVAEVQGEVFAVLEQVP